MAHTTCLISAFHNMQTPSSIGACASPTLISTDCLRKYHEGISTDYNVRFELVIGIQMI
uniref:Uncharacterized protein n=1 Tax=Arundo donax TaxID=35708 RepID=A0A0A9ED74_ARUDO